jgi:FkbM family methyltransferase
LKVDKVEYGGLTFNYRHDTTDWGIIQEACGGLNTKFFDVEEGELWLDIGAHIGSFTCYAAKKGAAVFAFEPIPENYNLLVENVAINNLEQRVQTWNKAVGSDQLVTTIFIDRQNFGNCSKYHRNGTPIMDMINAPIFPAKRFNEYDEFCIKIDTEGAEYEILSSIDLSKVQKLIMENHYWLQPEQETLDLIDLVHNFFNNVEEYGGYMIYAWN